MDYKELDGILFVFILLGGFSFELYAQKISAGPMPLARVIEIAKERNPDISAARKSWEAAKARVLAAKTWPDPQVGVEYWGFALGSPNLFSAGERWFDVSQMIPFPGKLHLRGKAFRHQAEREKQLYLATELGVLTKVKETYYDFFYADLAIRIFEEDVEILRQFARIAESKYGVGRASQSDVLRAQAELSKMINNLIIARQDLETAQAKLNALLDRNPEEPLGTPRGPSVTSLNYSFKELEEMATHHRPEIHAAGHHVNHMRAELAASRADYLPDLMVQYTARTMVGRDPDAIAMLKFNLPIVWFWRQGSVVKAVSSEREHAQAMLKSAQAMTRYEVKAFLVHVQTSQKLVELYKTTLIPQAEQGLKVAQAGYQSDRIGFLELLDSMRTLIEFKLGYYRFLAGYGKNLAHLERIVGVDLSVAKTEEHLHE